MNNAPLGVCYIALIDNVNLDLLCQLKLVVQFKELSLMEGSLFMQKVLTYLKEVRQELKMVTWPTRDQVIKMSAVVVVASVIVGVYIGGLDFVFTSLLGNIIK